MLLLALCQRGFQNHDNKDTTYTFPYMPAKAPATPSSNLCRDAVLSVLLASPNSLHRLGHVAVSRCRCCPQVISHYRVFLGKPSFNVLAGGLSNCRHAAVAHG